MARETTNKINKARYWVGVLYPENMIEDWESKISDTVQVPFAYAVHDKDVDSEDDERRGHIHLILVFSNTTTYKHAMSVFNLLSAEGKKALNKIEAVINIRSKYEYLIHNTEGSKNKYQYPKEARITGNNFDIGSYEQLSLAERDEITKELTIMITDRGIMNFADLVEIVLNEFDTSYFEVLQSRSSFFEKVTKGVFQRIFNARR